MKTRRNWTMALVVAMIMALATPLKAKAAETVTLVAVEAVYYVEVENEGTFNRHDENGNLISSEKVQKALFEVNSTLQSGWGQATVGETFIKGTFEDVTLDNKGYLRCIFTTESGVVYDDVKVKVKANTYKKLSAQQATKVADSRSTSDGNTGDGNTGGENTGGENAGGGNAGGGNAGGGNAGGGNTGDPNPGHGGWIDAPTDAPKGDPNPGHGGWTD